MPPLLTATDLENAKSYLLRAAEGGEKKPHGIWIRAGYSVSGLDILGGLALMAFGARILVEWDQDYPLVRILLMSAGAFLLCRGVCTRWLERTCDHPRGTFVDGDSVWELGAWELRRLPLERLRSFRSLQGPAGASVHLTWTDRVGRVVANDSAHEAEVVIRWLEKAEGIRRHLRSNTASERLVRVAGLPGGIAAAIAAEFVAHPRGQRFPVYPPPDIAPDARFRMKTAPLHVALAAALAVGVLLLGFAVERGPKMHRRYVEGLAYQRLLASSLASDARAYVDASPDGPHSGEALILYDNRLYSEAARSGSLEGLRAYLLDRRTSLHRAEALAEYDDRSYAAVVDSKSVERLGSYLADSLVSRHKGDARARIDDLTFGLAEQERSADGQLRAMRAYLASGINARHRSEATRALENDSAEIIARMEATMQSAENREFVRAFITLFRDTVAAAGSDVPVAITGIEIAEPDPDGREGMAERRLLDPLDDANPSAAPLDRPRFFEPDGAFGASVSRLREGVILKRLNEAVAAAFQSDVFRFVPAKAPSTGAPMRIRYEIRPTGRMIRYVGMAGPPERTGSAASQTATVRGLLRLYAIDWTLQLSSKGDEKPVALAFSSEQVSELTLEAGKGDPPWAPYAVQLYAAFYDFADRILAQAGVPAPARPASFSFKEASGQ